MKINELLAFTIENKASDLHLSAGEPPLIRIDGENVGFADSEESSISMIDSIAAREAKRMANAWTKILREDIKEGGKVILSKQDLGRVYNGNVLPVMEIDYVKIPRLPSTSVETSMIQRVFGGDEHAAKVVSNARRQQGLYQVFKDFCEKDDRGCRRCALLAELSEK